ncbi:MAG: SEC-C domain-containing protein [Candidatus Omnitrophota bacterium]
MLNILFSNQLKSGKYFLINLNSYILHIYKSELKQAAQSIEFCSKEVDEEVNSAKNSSNGDKKNQLFLLSTYVNMLREYLVFWEQILKEEYWESWNTLQDILDLLRILKKFNKDNTKFYIEFIEKQLTGFEKLYPYKIFASPEIILKDVECSICGKDIFSLDCNHITGELYDGQMAHWIAKDIERLSAISLVENPKDKRCVFQLENSEADFHLLTYLTKAVKELNASPWSIEGVIETTRKREIGELDIKGDEMCPCGSGRKFGDCCEKIGYVELPYMDIIITQNLSLETNPR